MPSTALAQIDRVAINRANSQHSTGPRTESGKQRSSLNALRHGLTARTAVLYFQIASLNPGAGTITNVLDDSGGSILSGNVIIQSSSGSGPELEWNIISAGGGYFTFVNRVSGLVLDLNGGVGPTFADPAGFRTKASLSLG
jgi:hypothetical protein